MTRLAAIMLLVAIISACAPRQRVEIVNPSSPGAVDTVMVRKVVRSE